MTPKKYSKTIQRILVLAVALLLTATFPAVADRGDDTDRKSKNGKVMGTLDGVDVTDALLIAMFTQDLALPTTTCYERIDFGCGDVNRDNVTSILDAVLIARHYVGLVELVWPEGTEPLSTVLEILDGRGVDWLVVAPPISRGSFISSRSISLAT